MCILSNSLLYTSYPFINILIKVSGWQAQVQLPSMNIYHARALASKRRIQPSMRLNKGPFEPSSVPLSIISMLKGHNRVFKHYIMGLGLAFSFVTPIPLINREPFRSNYLSFIVVSVPLRLTFFKRFQVN